jgi:hypothetical protein
VSLALNGELNHNGEPPTRRLSERKPLTLNPSAAARSILPRWDRSLHP